VNTKAKWWRRRRTLRLTRETAETVLAVWASLEDEFDALADPHLLEVGTLTGVLMASTVHRLRELDADMTPEEVLV